MQDTEKSTIMTAARAVRRANSTCMSCVREMVRAPARAAAGTGAIRHSSDCTLPPFVHARMTHRLQEAPGAQGALSMAA
ncbi:hypothetical protein J2T09_001283 [Neorhizobium huautlense]|uniref:Uncharacterized protein n=1 Tax=Neorhizobium huautlense TaxID=67774 RepID=A0ABT9PRP4_9HYPH|nr:hypothetical protein [Neorhizobium huautlense]